MEQFLSVPHSVYQSQKHLEEKKLEQKQEQETIVQKDFDSINSAVNSGLNTSNNEHLVDLVLNSPRIKLSLSEKIVFDNPDTEESIADFVCALKRKDTSFSDNYFINLESHQKPLKLLSTSMPSQQTEELGSFSKSGKVRLNRLYSRVRAAYGLCKT